jgi:hypothetical protein
MASGEGFNPAFDAIGSYPARLSNALAMAIHVAVDANRTVSTCCASRIAPP